jgi:hypothetical protein
MDDYFYMKRNHVVVKTIGGLVRIGRLLQKNFRCQILEWHVMYFYAKLTDFCACVMEADERAL